MNKWFAEVAELVVRLEDVRERYYDENDPSPTFWWNLTAIDEALSKMRELLVDLKWEENEDEDEQKQ